MDFARQNQHPLQCVMEKKWSLLIRLSPRGLEKALHQALTLANERHHEYATLEHLLLALMRAIAEAAAVMRACNVISTELKHTVLTYIDTELDNLVTGYDGGLSSRPPASSASSSAP